MHAALMVLLLFSQSGGAPAAAPRNEPAAKSQAQALLREGTRLYRKGQYQEALERFTGAYALFPSPKLHFNIAQANRELGRPVEALAAFERFLGDPAGSPRPVTDEARRSAADLRAQLGQLQVECDTAGADILLDGAAVGRTPQLRPIWCTPGNRTLSLQRQGFVPFEETVVVQPGSIHTLRASLRRLKLDPDPYQGTYAAPAPRDTAPSRGSGVWSDVTKQWWFWGAVAAVAVGGGVAAAATITR
jgi:tetratricopeptide (TPR) repeat protein